MRLALPSVRLFLHLTGLSLFYSVSGRKGVDRFDRCIGICSQPAVECSSTALYFLEVVPATAAIRARIVPMSNLPTGTVTFLFTDIEGSTTRWEQHREAMQRALARHDAIVREAIEGHGRTGFTAMDAGRPAVFTMAPDAILAALVPPGLLQRPCMAAHGAASLCWRGASGHLREHTR